MNTLIPETLHNVLSDLYQNCLLLSLTVTITQGSAWVLLGTQ